jgi:hypothetical protein
MKEMKDFLRVELSAEKDYKTIEHTIAELKSSF